MISFSSLFFNVLILLSVYSLMFYCNKSAAETSKHLMFLLKKNELLINVVNQYNTY